MALLNFQRLALLVGLAWSATCQAQSFDEYQVKAAFLYTLTRFIEWPAGSFPRPSTAMTICVLGADPFGSFLDDAIRGKMIEEHPLLARRLADRQTGGCHILFIAASEQPRMRSLLASLSAPGLLTVGDTADFAAQGGIVGMRLEGDHIRLIVNLTASEQAKLKISSRVLSLASIVR